MILKLQVLTNQEHAMKEYLRRQQVIKYIEVQKIYKYKNNKQTRQITINIAKGTTDPRVEFISQDHGSQFTNLEHITISESRLSI